MSAALALPAADPRAGEHLRDGPPDRARAGLNPRRRADEVHFRIVYWLTFPAFVMSSAARRISPSKRPDRTRAPLGRPSLFGEARSAAQTCASLSLMG